MVKVQLLCAVFRVLLLIPGKGTFCHSDGTCRAIENVFIRACNERCMYHTLLGNVDIKI